MPDPVEVSVDIDAPLERVWVVLLDFAAYAEWNPFVVGMAGETGVGGRVTLDVVFPSGRKARAREVWTRWEEPADGRARIAYRYAGRGRFLSLVTGHREQRLVALGVGRCRYETTEQLGGWLGPLLPMADVRAGIEAHAQAVKARAEALERATLR